MPQGCVVWGLLCLAVIKFFWQEGFLFGRLKKEPLSFNLMSLRKDFVGRYGKKG